MKVQIESWAVVLVACLLPIGVLRGQEPGLTPEQQKLQKEARALYAEGGKLYQEGSLPEATERLRRVVGVLEQVYPKETYKNGHLDLVWSLTTLAGLLQAQGEYGQAEPLIRRALQMQEALYPRDKPLPAHPLLATSLYNLAFLLAAEGEYARAESLARRALQVREALYPRERYPNGHPDIALSLTNLAVLLEAQGEYARAEPLARRALQMREGLYPKEEYPQGHSDLASSLTTLALLLRDQGEHSQAEPLVRRTLKMHEALYSKDKYPQGHPHLATSLTNLGVLLKDQGEYEQAEVLYRRALQMREALYPRDRFRNGHPDIALSLTNLAVLLMAQEKYGKAEPLFRRALEMYRTRAEQVARSAPEPVALNYAATFPLTRDGLLSATRDLPDSVADTCTAVWHSKAALTRVYQRRHLALIAAATDESVRKDWDNLQSLRRQREQLIMAPLPNPSQQPARREKLDKLNEQIDKVELTLLPHLPVLKHYEDLARLDPDAVQKFLSDDAVLIDFLRYTHFEQDRDKPGKKGEKRTPRYLAFAVSRKDIRRVELTTAADIDAAVKEWREAITLQIPKGNAAARKEHEAKLLRLGERLRELVWEPVQKQLPAGVKTVFLAPDAELTQLPWAALPGGGKDRILLDDYALAVLPHGPALLEWLTPPPPRSEKRSPVPQGLLLVGGIKYDDRPAVSKDGQQREAEAVIGQKVIWNYLEGTDEERQLLEKLLAKRDLKLTASLGGSDAATERLRKELEQARYAHFGTHGFFAGKTFRSVLQLDPKLFDRQEFLSGSIGERRGEGARSPLVLSGLVCAGANLADTPERGILSADAIAGLLLDDLHLAVLSACDTGIGDVAGGEGVYGLQRAFHIAGCKNVVASLWKVDDAATAALMTRFYGHLFAEEKEKRLPPIEALRRAQLELYRHPELIPAWAKGESRAPGQPRPATTPPPPDTPQELLTSDGRAPIRLWAAFTLSGLGL